MSLGDIILIEEYNGIKNYACALKTQDIFLNGSFLEDKKLLVANNNEKTLTINYPIKNKKLIFENSLEKYLVENKDSLEQIKNYLQNKGIILSWLQSIQINEMNKLNNNIDLNISLLKKVYLQILPNNKETTFLDF